MKRNGETTARYRAGLCSVVMPVHNGGKYVASSLESVLQQTFTNLELVIIDDASTDDSLKTIQECIKDCDIKVKIISTRSAIHNVTDFPSYILAPRLV